MAQKVNLGNNPFTVGLKIKVNKVIHKESVSKDGGGAAWSWSDASFSTQIFHVPKGYNDETLEGERNVNKRINHLPPNACKLLYWIMRNMRYNEDNIYVSHERYVNECGVSLKTFRVSMKELCHEGFLAKIQGVKFRYWVNPTYIFCGNP